MVRPFFIELLRLLHIHILQNFHAQDIGLGALSDRNYATHYPCIMGIYPMPRILSDHLSRLMPLEFIWLSLISNAALVK